MSYGVLCDGCGEVLSQSCWGRADRPPEVPNNTWVVEPPGNRDALRRFEFIVHACNKACLRKWLSRKDSTPHAEPGR